MVNDIGVITGCRNSYRLTFISAGGNPAKINFMIPRVFGNDDVRDAIDLRCHVHEVTTKSKVFNTTVVCGDVRNVYIGNQCVTKDGHFIGTSLCDRDITVTVPVNIVHCQSIRHS